MNEESTLHDAVFNRDLEETVQKAKIILKKWNNALAARSIIISPEFLLYSVVYYYEIPKL